jgi:hypothetical protein
MSFLNQLKSQAEQLRDQQSGSTQDLAAITKTTEMACVTAWKYLQDFCAQLNVIKPPASGRYSLDGKAAFPQLQMLNFRCDSRKKMHRGQEMFDYIGVAWDLLPTTGQVATHSVTVNFPPDLERVTKRLSFGQIKHERKDLRHPDTNKLQAYVFEYQTQSRGSVTLTPDQDIGQISFRLVNTEDFGVNNINYPAAQVTSGLLDELAKRIVGQQSRFV